MRKDMATSYLKELNRGTKEAASIITRLYYNDKGDFVQDLSFFANKKYTSEGLLASLKKGQTPTSSQEEELQQFIIEKVI